MRFDLVTHDPNALFNIIAKQQRYQAAFEANDAERRQTAKRGDARSMAAAGTKPQGSAADEHDSREVAKAAGVKAERETTTTSVSYVASRDTSIGTAPKASRVRRGKASMARATARSLYSSSSPQAVSLSVPGTRQPGWPLRLPPLELVRTRPPQKRWLRRPNLLRLNHLRRMTMTTVYIRVARERMAPVDYGLTETVQHQVSQSAGPQNAAPVLHSVPVQLPAPASQQSCGDLITISYARVSVLPPGGSGDRNVDTVETKPHLEALTQHVGMGFSRFQVLLRLLRLRC